ncbi:sister chromatid cohesion protein SCC2 isoform X2 [Cryptomeria japonica]|uniref:sister chromatid cohesion protein SCC2 isoform X2 n=1 Tax=Cryptomeria japonica TaxID=3369 RepID=UPI0027DAA628|nr:sister chromatid cohesion protein SCC2 isoform X2 [Cryptomeria japonica]
MATHRLCLTSHTEIVPYLPLLHLPFCFGANSQELSLVEDGETASRVRAAESSSVMSVGSKIAELLKATDVSYLCLKYHMRNEEALVSSDTASVLAAVLDHDPSAFSCKTPGNGKLRGFQHSSSDRGSQQNQHSGTPLTYSHKGSSANPQDMQTPLSATKSRLRRKVANGTKNSGENAPGIVDLGRDTGVGHLCEIVDGLFERTELPGEEDGEGSSCIPFSNIKVIEEEVMAADLRKTLNLVPVGHIVKLLDILRQYVCHSCDKALGDEDDVDSDNYISIMSALEAVQLSLTIMTHPNMPKQVYKEEIIDKIVDYSRQQIVQSVFIAYDPSYWMIHKGGGTDGIEEEHVNQHSKSGKKGRCQSKGWKTRKVSTAVSNVFYKLCSILGLFKDLLSIERLLDSSVLQLIKTSLTTFTIENIQLLQLKAIGVTCAVFSSYPEYRTIIMDEIVQLLWKLPSSKRNLRSYHLPDDEQKQIQMITALVLQLVQCSVTLPEPIKTAFAVNAAAAADFDPSKCFDSAVESCRYFWGNLLQYLSVPRSQDISDIKIIIENLVIDLLITINVPEYPAASLLLQILCVLLFGNAGLKSKDVIVRGIAIDLLGQIAARLKRDSVVCSNDKHWILRELWEDSSEYVVPEEMCVVCQGQRTANFMIVCEGCQQVFHGECIGYTGHNQTSRGWVCYCCICRKQLASLNSHFQVQSEKLKDSEPCFRIKGVAVIEQILLNYLKEVGSTDNLVTYACQFYLCEWFKDEPNALQMLPFYHGRCNLKVQSMGFGIASASFSRDVITCISAALGQKRALARGFDKILDRLLVSLQENSPTLRAKALRAVSTIVEADPGVLGDTHVRCAVEGRFLDSAISVREASVELVGRHIVSRPDVAEKYFNKVAERIMDKGVSVRKRVIKIIRDICIMQCNFAKTTDAYYHIISRISDEETSIQDLVCKTFYELWFEEPSSSQTGFVGDGSIVPLEIAERTQQLVNVLIMLNNNQPLVTIIRRTMALDFCVSKNSGTSAVSQAAVRNRCELMCKCLLESILKAEETNTAECEIQALPYVLALHAFCIVDPTLCAPASDPSRFVVTLQPYLKTQAYNRTIAQLLQSIVFVIDAVLPFLRRPPPNFVEELERDLRQLIARYSFLFVVDACIKCLCALTKVSTKGVTSFGFLLKKFFKYLHAGHKVLYGTTDQPLLLRCLYCLGLLVRYGAELIDCEDKGDISVIDILSLFKHYHHLEDVVVKARSLQALGFVCIAKPEFMMEKDIRIILEESLSSNSDTRIKVQALRNFYDYLVDVEEQMGQVDIDNDSRVTKENGAVPVAAGEGDNNICGGIIQLHWQNILEKCLDVNDQVRQSALKIVEIVLRQGLVHPVTCVPYLIASVVDEQETNSNMAHSLLIYMNEKYPSFFDSRIGDGIELSFRFIQSVHGKVFEDGSNNFDGSTAASVKGGISRIYNLIRRSRVSRNKFVSSILHKFDHGSLENSSLLFLVYCTEVLASLPFVNSDEPLYLVQVINRTVQPRAGNLEASMKKLASEGPFQKIMKRALKTVEGNKHKGNKEVDSFQVIKLRTSGVFKALDEIQGITANSIQKVKADCHAAVAFSLLLRLKRHMKIVYGLSDARCQAFSSTEAIRLGDVLTKQNIPFSTVGIPTASPRTVQQVLEQYQVLKRSLEEDSFDYSSPANVSRKRPRTVVLEAGEVTGDLQSNGHIPSKSLRRKNLFALPKNDKGEISEGNSEDEYQPHHKQKRPDNNAPPKSRRKIL